MNTYTYAHGSHLHFENTVGRVLVHPSNRYLAIEYFAGPRKPTEIQDFLHQAGYMLSHCGWDKLLNEHLAMPDFTGEEMEDIKNYWRTNVAQSPSLLYGALLLPHKLFAQLSWISNATSTRPAAFILG
ncbi:MAG: hypothetical protein EOO56_22415 [Hymenobacter sp.]|nr:MAG: hypothetical protein EOO56_22415 [Hymenobacter sp.]